jgi:luciferase family oxidoreductase group 1
MDVAVLDQVPVFAGSGPVAAAQESVRLAREAERLGYRRFWIAEHHEASCGCGSPEVLVTAAAAATSSIRVGAGAVLLPYYQPLKVATTFNLLARLFPDRIDLGIGRGPGASQDTARLLAPEPGAAYEDRLAALLGFLSGPAAASYLPAVTPAQVWVVGSGPGGALAAARSGRPFCLAQFVHDGPRPELLDLYLDNFDGSRENTTARTGVCIRVACADDPDDARVLADILDMPAAAPRRGAASVLAQLPSWDELRRLAPRRPRPPSMAMLAGVPAEVSEKLSELLAIYRPDELVVTTACPRFDLRVRTFELISAMSLAPASARAQLPAAARASRPATEMVSSTCPVRLSGPG